MTFNYDLNLISSVVFDVYMIFIYNFHQKFVKSSVANNFAAILSIIKSHSHKIFIPDREFIPEVIF